MIEQCAVGRAVHGHKPAGSGDVSHGATETVSLMDTIYQPYQHYLIWVQLVGETMVQ